MITTWDLFHKQTSQSTQVSGLNYLRGHDLIICKSRLKSREELRLKHFKWMTNVTLNFQDIRKKSNIHGISQVKDLRTSQAQNAVVFSNQNQKGSSMQFGDVEWL